MSQESNEQWHTQCRQDHSISGWHRGHVALLHGGLTRTQSVSVCVCIYTQPYTHTKALGFLQMHMHTYVSHTHTQRVGMYSVYEEEHECLMAVNETWGD